MYLKLLHNHVLASLAMVLVILGGWYYYASMPRQQDPSINFNWVSIITPYPGATAESVETKVTDIIETELKAVRDINFITSNSRENLSTITLRFNEISDALYDKRIAEVRRKLQKAEESFPAEVNDSRITEISSGNAFPSAMIAVSSDANNEALHKRALMVKKRLEQINGVNRVVTLGLRDVELQITFDPQRLHSLNLSPVQLAERLRPWFNDISAGTLDIAQGSWQVQLNSKTLDPEAIGNIPITSYPLADVRLRDIASIKRGLSKATELVSYNGKPAVHMGILRQDSVHLIKLVDTLNAFVLDQNKATTAADTNHTQVHMLDDQTLPTLKAINLMEFNSLIGLLLVIVITWLFMGLQVGFVTCVAIPFILAGTIAVVGAMGFTLNVTVLLGIIIVLGMLVDDAVVVVESIHHHHQRMPMQEAILTAMREVAVPVTTAVLTTIAAFMPLMLLPGILGKFMMIVPMVVSLALVISLIEVFWLMPSHLLHWRFIHRLDLRFGQGLNHRRQRFMHQLRTHYTRWLIFVIRKPYWVFAVLILSAASAITLMKTDRINLNFFAGDTLRVFYINVEMDSTAALKETLAITLEAEKRVRRHLADDEARSVVAYAGAQFTDTAPQYADNLGQITVSLNPSSEISHPRAVDDIVAAMRDDVTSVKGAHNISFLVLKNGPPTSKAVEVKVTGPNYDAVKLAADAILSKMQKDERYVDVESDASPGKQTFNLSLNQDAIRNAGVNPAEVAQTLSYLVNGQVISQVSEEGEQIDIKLKTNHSDTGSIDTILNQSLLTAQGQTVPLSTLLKSEKIVSLGNVRHYNYLRTITLSADLDGMDAVSANEQAAEWWQAMQKDYPGVSLNYAGQLDDIKESQSAMIALFLFGLGVMYTILGTQFGSFSQPLIILCTVPLAFIGVVWGLFYTGHPLSLYTLYGVIALSGISVNAAIVLFSAANQRLDDGLSLGRAIVYACKRRVTPIVITTITTISGMFSLAFGLAGHSMIWGPVATAIVFGIAYATLITLFLTPIIYIARHRVVGALKTAWREMYGTA